MADYPCDMHRTRYNGPSTRVYLNIYSEDNAAKLKGSVCGDCLAELVSDWLSWALRQSADGWVIPEDDAPSSEVPWMPSDGPIKPLNGSRRW